jgi:hypothetical protein
MSSVLPPGSDLCEVRAEAEKLFFLYNRFSILFEFGSVAEETIEHRQLSVVNRDCNSVAEIGSNIIVCVKILGVFSRNYSRI